jgi:CRISPR/Cas system CMR-associated protein Cmr5 small subunit
MAVHAHSNPTHTMWQKLKDQIPTIILTAALILGVAFWFNKKQADEMASKQAAELASIREQHSADMKANAEETRRHIEAVNTLLKDAISKRAADVFMTDEEVAKLNEQKVNQLAEAIAAKVMPYGSNIPKTPEEAEKLQNEQVDKVSSRMAEKISPILSEMTKDQGMTREKIDAYSQRISDQISGVLTSEMSRNQELNTQLLASQAVAQDSMKLSHELTALYLSSFKDQGVLTRLLTLPANIVRDTSKLSFVNSTDRKKMEERLVTEMNELEKRLNEVQANTPKK